MSRIRISDSRIGLSGWEYSFWGHIDKDDVEEIERHLEQIKAILLAKDKSTSQPKEEEE